MPSLVRDSEEFHGEGLPLVEITEQLDDEDRIIGMRYTPTLL